MRRRIILGIMGTLSLCLGTLVWHGCGLENNPPSTGVEVAPSDGTAGFASAGFNDPTMCGACHPTHFREWQGSIMHYSATSPVFNAFELTVEKLTSGAFAANPENGVTENFCIGCHSPTGVFNGELPSYVDEASATPARDNLSPVSQQGLSCDFCHTVTGPDLDKSFLNDGIANLSLIYGPSDTKWGPVSDSVDVSYHDTAESPYLQSPEFCGSCHDVRIPIPDPVTGEPFQRLENLFTEWKNGPYNSTDNPHGKVVRCQDCHMSLYPIEPPGVFPTMTLGVGVDVPERKHAIHAFTAVSIPFVDSPQFPNIDTDAKDEFGFPLGQKQRRTQMLRAACTLTLDGTPASLATDAEVIPIRIVVTNTGTGHRVPSGFSQERQVWVELVVSDDAGVIYESGYLRDQAHPETGEMEPDGLQDDEDLNDHHFDVDMETLDTVFHDGPDHNQRPERNLGMVSFQNKFIRIHEDGSWETVINPLLADHMDNSHSLDMLTPTPFRYDVPIPDRGIVGDIRVTARLRYRAFPPEFLRILAIREPELVSEDIVDRNTIVDMAEADAVISVR